MELLEGTPESEFLKTPIKRSLSREGIGKVIYQHTNRYARTHKFRDEFTLDQFNRQI